MSWDKYLCAFKIHSSNTVMCTYLNTDTKLDAKHLLIDLCRRKFNEDPEYINIYKSFKNDIPPSTMLYVDFT